MSRNFYEPEDEDADDLPQPTTGCDCRPNVVIRQAHQHDPNCPHHEPPLVGPGSTPEHRARALAEARAALDAHRRKDRRP